MASIEGGGPQKQAERAAPATGPLTAALAGQEPRWVFICYSWASEREVTRFHDLLEQRLRNRSRSYRIFRDKARDPDKRILAGENYRGILAERLAEAACCLVVLVPDIFRSDECRLEVEQFQRRVAGGGKCFFMPVEFVGVAAEMGAPEGSHPIADALRFTNRVDFTGLWSSGSGDPLYEAAVDAIAADIDRLWRKANGLLPPPDTETEQESAGGGRRRAGPLAAALAAAVLLAAGAVALVPPLREAALELLGWRGEPEIAWAARAPLDLFAPAPAYDAPGGALRPEPAPAMPLDGIAEGTLDGETWYRVGEGDGAFYLRAGDVREWLPHEAPVELLLPTPAAAAAGGPEAGTLGPGAFEPPEDALAVSPDGAWYRIAPAAGAALVVPAAAAPEWTALPEGLDLAAALPLRDRPERAAPASRRLVPGDPVEAPRSASLGGEAWYRLRDRGADGFVPEAETAGRLVAWREVAPACLVGAGPGTVFAEAAAGAASLGGFGEGQLVARGGRLRRASIGGADWYRFERPEAEPGFVPADAVCQADCADPQPCD